MVAVVGAVERLVADVGHGVELRPRSGRTTTFVTASEQTADGSGRADRLAQDGHLEPAQLDRLLGAERAQQVVRSTRRSRARPVPAAMMPGRSRRPSTRPLSTRRPRTSQPSRPSRPRATAAANQPRHIFWASAKPPSGSYAAPATPSIESSGSTAPISSGSQEPRLEAEPLQQLDVAAAGRHEPLGDGQQVAAAHVAGVGHAHLVGAVHDRARARDRQPRGHGVRVVSAHHREASARSRPTRALHDRPA